MAGTVVGGNQNLIALVESAESERDLLLESLLELKVITLHLAEIAGVQFGEEDVELNINQ